MDIGWKLVSAGAGIVSGIIANKAVDVVWKSVSGRARPEEDDFSEPLRTALVFSVVSAAVGAVVNELVMRRGRQGRCGGREERLFFLEVTLLRSGLALKRFGS